MTESPNKLLGWKNQIQGIVIHYTASQNAKGSYNWLMSPDSKASAHVVIDYDGTILNVVDVENRAFHAGVSAWGGVSGCNNFMLGIELANAGICKLKDNKQVDTYGKELVYNKTISDKKNNLWQCYPEAQITSCVNLIEKWIKDFPTIKPTWIVGHEHVAPGRKTDPGYAFPWHTIIAVCSDVSSDKISDSKALQSHLERLEFDVGEVDGLIGPTTKRKLTECLNKYNSLQQMLNNNFIEVKDGSITNIVSPRGICEHLIYFN